MTTVKNILQKKGYQVWSVPPDTTILDALKLMAEKNVGALPVMKDNRLVGVFSERDYARRGILQGRDSSTEVCEVMTPLVYYITLQQTIEDCMALMTEKHIRHLPVIEDEQVVGFVSIGDVVNSIIENQQYHIRGLENYIMGGEFTL